MPQVCKICKHPKRDEIEKALVKRESLRDIAGRYPFSRSSLLRHKSDHLPARLKQAKEMQEMAAARARQNFEKEPEDPEQETVEDLAATLKKIMQRVNLLFDACDRWLRDADNPEQYDIGPRAEDLKVTYMDMSEGKTIRRKERLSVLLPRIEAEQDITIMAVESKYADPRQLVLQASGRLGDHLELLAKILGMIQGGPTVNVLVMPEWVQTRNTIVAALADFPDARLAVGQALIDLEKSNVHRA